MKPVLDLELLRTFVAVVEQGELKKAALQVHRSQAAVSMQLKRLESQLDSCLMERSNQGIRLTDSGETLLAYARQLLHLNQQTLSALSPEPLRDRLRFGIPSDYANTFTRQFIPQLRAALPQLQATICCAPSRRLREQLANDSLDIIIVSGETAHDPQPVLWSEPQRWVAPLHCQPEQLDSLPVALLDTDCIIRDLTLRHLKQSGRTWHSVFTSSSLENVATAVEAGMAITLLSESLIDRQSMRVLDEAVLPGSAQLSMHLIIASQVSEQARREVSRCMAQVVATIQS